MAGGPIHPVSAQVDGDDGFIYPTIFEGDGTSALDYWHGWGVADSTTATGDQQLYLVFDIPEDLPSGTPNLKILSRADATANTVAFIVEWASVDDGDDPSSTSLSSEGTPSATVTWTTGGGGDDDVLMETLLELNATTAPAAGEQLIMEITYDDSSSGLLVESVHQFSIVWV